MQFLSANTYNSMERNITCFLCMKETLHRPDGLIIKALATEVRGYGFKTRSVTTTK